MGILAWVLTCMIIADFFTGFFHWFEDTWITPQTPLLGKSVGEPNVEHHKHPGLMGTMSTFLYRNLIPMILAIVAIGIALIFGFFCWQLVLIAALASLGNEVHQWNHMPKPKNWLVRVLQDAAIVQTKKQHNQHHKKPYDKYYCTLTNFTNVVLEEIRFWRMLEWICVNIFRMKIKRLSEEREGY